MMTRRQYIALIGILLLHFAASDEVFSQDINSNKILGDCGACKLLVESFTKLYGSERSRTDEHLFAIKQKLCADFGDYSHQCRQLFEQVESKIDDWWNKNDETDLFSNLCIENLNYCCPAHHYGPECLPCNTDVNNVCGGNGKCKGDGTRKGNGNCACDPGYEDDQCGKCSEGYFEKSRNETNLVCEKCHIACKGGCSSKGVEGCSDCNPGWKYTKALGCVDIDECANPKRCSSNEFCINQMGSYTCMECDSACVGCDGDGPDNCKLCALGHSKVQGVCVSDRFSVTDTMSSTRYHTYIGLASASIILLTKSRTMGSVVGALVMFYIACAEYYCMISGHSDGIFNINDFDFKPLFKSAKK